MNIVELIRKKRNKEALTKDEINYLVSNYVNGRIPDYQFSAFLMAVYLNGMNVEETAALTGTMLNSGKVVDLSAIKGVKVDKHSTGGVGDKTSLIIAPIVAAAGLYVPMISGRGLGHTGGTLDKLDSISGFNTNLTLNEYKRILKKVGTVLAGQTKEIAPADKLMYALRDVTATIESIPLITSSIMSKKLAEGIDALVLDVKTGSGAFMRDYKHSKALAESLVNTAKSFDKKVIAFITDMNQPVGNYIGNWFEIYESMIVLQGEWVEDLCSLSFTLSGAMLYMGGKADSINEGFELSKEIVNSGKAFDKWIEMVKSQGGSDKYILNPGKYPPSKFKETVFASKSGYVSEIDTYEIGMAALGLGAGRLKKEDRIDPKAGIVFYPKIGDKISRGGIIADFYTDRKGSIDECKERIRNAVSISPESCKAPKLIKKVLY